MMGEPTSFLIEYYGLAGIVIIGLASFVMYEIRQHRKERDDWKAQAGAQHRELIHSGIKFNETLSKNTSAIEGVKTLIESMDRRINN